MALLAAAFSAERLATRSLYSEICRGEEVRHRIESQRQTRMATHLLLLGLRAALLERAEVAAALETEGSDKALDRGTAYKTTISH
jgi:hypothetical protein